jgi:hypothetical protein
VTAQPRASSVFTAKTRRRRNATTEPKEIWRDHRRDFDAVAPVDAEPCAPNRALDL